MKPLAIDLFCGLGGWTEGLLLEGYRVVGFDIERHVYGDHAYPAQLVIQDVLTLHGAQFKDAALIVASPPCQGYSYRAMPWKRAKALPPPDNSLFEACFRIQREACEASGRYIPLVVENVRGAQKWVGRSRYHFGSFHLWGDVPALMPMTKARNKVPNFRFDGSGKSFQSASVEHTKGENGCLCDGENHIPRPQYVYCDCGLRREETKNSGGSWFNIGSPGQKETGRNPVHEAVKASKDGLGGYGGDFGWDDSPMRRNNSKSLARKAASAMIAKIPLVLSRHIAASWHPHVGAAFPVSRSTDQDVRA